MTNVINSNIDNKNTNYIIFLKKMNNNILIEL